MQETPQMRDNRRETAKKRAEKAKKKTLTRGGHAYGRVGYDPAYAAAYDRIFGKKGKDNRAT